MTSLRGPRLCFWPLKPLLSSENQDHQSHARTKPRTSRLIGKSEFSLFGLEWGQRQPPPPHILSVRTLAAPGPPVLFLPPHRPWVRVHVPPQAPQGAAEDSWVTSRQCKHRGRQWAPCCPRIISLSPSKSPKAQREGIVMVPDLKVRKQRRRGVR